MTFEEIRIEKSRSDVDFWKEECRKALEAYSISGDKYLWTELEKFQKEYHKAAWKNYKYVEKLEKKEFKKLGGSK